LVGLLLLAVVMGVFDQLVEHEWSDRVLTLAGMLLGIVLITTGCQHDSREWSYTITKPLRLLLIFIAIIGVPIYLLRTRGLRGLISIAMAVAFFGILLLLEQLAIAITDRVECLLTK
jgi:UDP-N-acetylmuramyl pentapeptide phosphotransferase/UDP-N-acetylglucosamine-1-phosphate transferase